MLLLTTPAAKTIRQDATWWLGSTVWYDRKDARDVASSAQVRATVTRWVALTFGSGVHATCRELRCSGQLQARLSSGHYIHVCFVFPLLFGSSLFVLRRHLLHSRMRLPHVTGQDSPCAAAAGENPTQSLIIYVHGIVVAMPELTSHQWRPGSQRDSYPGFDRFPADPTELRVKQNGALIIIFILGSSCTPTIW